MCRTASKWSSRACRKRSIQQGLQVEKVSSGFLLLITLTSSDGKLDDVALSDYLARNVMNEIKRLDGVGKAQLYGAERAMRIWIDPQKLIGFNLTPADVNAAIVAQNAQVSAGSIGDLPTRTTQEITATILVKGQLSTPEEFADIVLKANPGRLHRAHQRCGAGRDRQPGIPVLHAPERQAVHRRRRAAVAGRQRPEHRDPGAGEDG